MTDEQNNMQETPAPGNHKIIAVDKVHAVLKDIEDGLETVKELPEHVVAWLRAKVQEIKSHL